jgi:hypothetical protein
LIFDLPNRPRRRVGRIIWPILIVGAVSLALVVSAGGAQTRTQIEYLATVHDHAVEMARNAEALRLAAGGLATISRDEFVIVTENILEDLADAMTFAEGEPPTPSVIPVRSLMRQALIAWSAGVEGFYQAVLGAADRPGDPTVVDDMAAALAELRAGDAIYALLLTEVEREDVPAPLSPLPEVAMSPARGGLVGLSLAYVEAARSPQNTLVLRPGLAVSQVVAEPEWQLDATGRVVMPSTAEVVFTVVMTNVGNVVSVPQLVVLTLVGGADTVLLELEVEALAPGRQVSLVFDPLPVESGQSYQVTVAIEGEADDSNPEDNAITVVFAVNPG